MSYDIIQMSYDFGFFVGQMSEEPKKFFTDTVIGKNSSLQNIWEKMRHPMIN